MMIQIRCANAADVPAMFRVRISVNENQMTLDELKAIGVTPESLPEMLKGQGRGWVAELNGEVKAFAMANAEEATIFALFVEPEVEGRGIGRRLMDEAEKWLAEMGCRDVWLETDSDMAVRANGFYRYTGWTESHLQPDGQVKFIKRL